MQYNASLNELDNMFVHLTNVAIQKYGVRKLLVNLESLKKEDHNFVASSLLFSSSFFAGGV